MKMPYKHISKKRRKIIEKLTQGGGSNKMIAARYLGKREARSDVN